MSDNVYYVNPYYVNLQPHGRGYGKPNTRNPKPRNHGRPPVPPPIDISIPSLHISPFSDNPKFFPQKLNVKFSLQKVNLKIFGHKIGSKFFSINYSPSVVAGHDCREYLWTSGERGELPRYSSQGSTLNFCNPGNFSGMDRGGNFSLVEFGEKFYRVGV